jgi:hypothetical protein
LWARKNGCERFYTEIFFIFSEEQNNIHIKCAHIQDRIKFTLFCLIVSLKAKYTSERNFFTKESNQNKKLFQKRKTTNHLLTVKDEEERERKKQIKSSKIKTKVLRGSREKLVPKTNINRLELRVGWTVGHGANSKCQCTA